MDGYPHPGDPIGGLRGLWWLKESFRQGVSPYADPLLAFPFGVDWGAGAFQPLLQWPLTFFAVLGGEVFSHNLYILISFPLSGMTMYYLARHLTGDWAASAVAGLVYAFSPHHFTLGMAYLGLTHMQWLPIFVLTLFRLAEAPSVRVGLACGGAFALVVLTNYYHGYFMTIFALLFLLCLWLHDRLVGRVAFLTWRTVRGGLVAVATAVALVLPFTYRIFLTALFPPEGFPAEAFGYVRPYVHFFKYAARLWDYVLPSEFHPLWGEASPAVYRFLTGEGGRHYFDATLFLGLVPLALSVYAFRQWRAGGREPRRDLAMLVLVLGLFTAIFFSLPPLISLGLFELPTPPYIFSAIAPMFRVSARFGVVAILAVSALAAIGLSELLGQLASARQRSVVGGLAALLVLAEFTPVPPGHTRDVTQIREVYRWLAAQPGEFAVAEYPLERSDFTEHYYYGFNQRIHRKPLINGAIGGTPAEAIRRTVTNLLDAETPARLAALGARHAIVHKDIYRELLDLGIGDPTIQRKAYSTETLRRLREAAGLRLIQEFPEALVFEVTADPVPVVLSLWGRFYGEERWPDGRRWRWMGDEGRFVLYRPGNSPVRLDLSFLAVSSRRERVVEIRLNGQEVARATVAPGEPTPVTIDALMVPPGLNTVSLTTRPGPEAQEGPRGERQVSIAISEARVGRPSSSSW